MKKATLEKRLEMAMGFIEDLSVYKGNPYEDDDHNRGINEARGDIADDAIDTLREIRNIVD